MADRAKEILDDCEHRQIAHPRYDCCGRCDGPCRACADRAVEVAREEEREACEKAAIAIRDRFCGELTVQSIHKSMAVAAVIDAIRARSSAR